MRCGELASALIIKNSLFRPLAHMVSILKVECSGSVSKVGPDPAKAIETFK